MPERGPALRGEVVLTRAEAFRICQDLADAGRDLLGSGRADGADRLASAFALLEGRLTAS